MQVPKNPCPEMLQIQLDLALLRLAAKFCGRSPSGPDRVPADATPDDVALATVNQRSQFAAQQAKLRSLAQQIIQKQDEAEEATAGIARLQASLPWAQAETDIRRKAKDLQYGNQLAWIEAERSLVEEQENLAVLARHRDQATAAKAALAGQIQQASAEFQDSVLQDLTRARAQASELEANLSKAEQRLELDTLRAPIDGTVESLAVHTVGGVVTPAQPLLLVVPGTAQLVVEAGVENKDVGFLHVGQRAEVKVETFSFTRYGMIHGTVVALSRDAVLDGAAQQGAGTQRDGTDAKQDGAAKTPSYMAQIALDRDWIDTESGRMTLGPGMAVTAEIYTGRRRIVSFLLSPLQRYTSESLHER